MDMMCSQSLIESPLVGDGPRSAAAKCTVGALKSHGFWIARILFEAEFLRSEKRRKRREGKEVSDQAVPSLFAGLDPEMS